MHKFRFLGKIPLILYSMLLVFACAGNNAMIKMANAVSPFAFTAEGTSEGILLHFKNIPDDAVHLSVIIEDASLNDGIFHQVLFWDNESFDFTLSPNKLSDLRESPALLVPFAKDGHEYIVSVSIYKDKNLDEWEEYTPVKAIANGGIYIINNPSLYFTDNNRNLTLSGKPVFSEEVEFSEINLYAYSVMVKLDEQNARGGGGNWNEFTFPAHEVYNGSQEYFGFTGRLPVTGSVQANLIHDNMEWFVGVAKTEEVIISF